MKYDRTTNDSRTMHTIPAAMDGSIEDDLVSDTDEPPDEQLERTPRPRPARLHTQEFEKSAPLLSSRKQSLLAQALHSPESDHPIEDDLANATQISRGMSSASVWSNTSAGSTAELTSDGGFTSPVTRENSPSPPLPPASFRGLPPVFNKPNFDHSVRIRAEDEHVGPFANSATLGPNEAAVEAGLGRKRCIGFACVKKEMPPPPVVDAEPKLAMENRPAQAKRPCTIRFACPSKVLFDTTSREEKAISHRQPSPAPRLARKEHKASTRSHRGSDSTVRNASPQATRKPIPIARARRGSDNSDVGRSEATRFHEFASSEEEVDDWVQESTCFRRRITISDTLKKENTLRKLGEEAEEEAMEEEAEMDDEENDEDDLEDIDEDENEQDNDEDDENLYEEESSDDGFKTDDEEGFAGSDDESDAGSDYEWWAPRRADASNSIPSADHIRPSARSSFSDSSVGSYGSGPDLPHGKLPPKSMRRRRPQPLNIRPRSPELPDSTDFVCGTLDEDRPAEEAYMSVLEARRVAKHRFTPQDIDPSFPTSDPEMDEEDEDEEQDYTHESDAHMMMVGSLEATDADVRGRARPNRTLTPDHQAKRFKSPPPIGRRPTFQRSPPPRRLFDSPPKRMRSPAPARRLRSPPPTRRASFAKSPKRPAGIPFVGLAHRPQAMVASSLPRTPITTAPPTPYDEDEETSREYFPSRGAIEIKAGLERKRQRRQEKLYRKYCKKEAEREKEKKVKPGMGCKKMREIGLEAISRKPREVPFPPTKEAMILSF